MPSWEVIIAISTQLATEMPIALGARPSFNKKVSVNHAVLGTAQLGSTLAGPPRAGFLISRLQSYLPVCKL
jgi:hypothetical protein